MPQHCSKKHRFPWGEGKGAIFSLDEVFWYLSPSAEMYPDGDMSLAGSSDHARAHEHRSALRQESGPFPGFPAGCGSRVPDFLVSPPPCRLQIHVPPGMPQPYPAGLPPAGPVPEPALAREHPPAALHPGTPGRGLRRGGRQPHGDRSHLLQRPDFLLPEGFTGGRAWQGGQPIGPADPGRAR